MYIPTYIHTYICIHIHTYTHTHIHAHTHAHIHIHAYTHTRIHTYTHTHAHILLMDRIVLHLCLVVFLKPPDPPSIILRRRSGQIFPSTGANIMLRGFGGSARKCCTILSIHRLTCFDVAASHDSRVERFNCCFCNSYFKQVVRRCSNDLLLECSLRCLKTRA